MPAATYINTPATSTGDGTYLTNGLERLGEMSPEKSFSAPRENGDLLGQMKKVQRNGLKLTTPRGNGRNPLRLLPNGNQVKAEFTPLMKSATKNNMARRLSGKKTVGPETPAFLRAGYNTNGATPALPQMGDISQQQSEQTTSSAGNADEFTPMPQNVSSSAHSTPLAQLPGRDSAGVVNDGNMMTLREQENIIDKIEKENFGLKMKIHFLEEAMSKRGGEFNQAALKENTELKVNRITMQRDLHKFRKNIEQAERDAEAYRQQLERYRERMRQKQADESVRIEVERITAELKEKDMEIARLQSQLTSRKDDQDAEMNKLRNEMDDLRADVREKDQLIEAKEDEVDALKMNYSKESNIAGELEDELEAAKQRIEELRHKVENATEEARAAKEDREDAIEEKKKAEDDLEELRDEMANKSFTTKGLSRQLEEKANKLEDDLEELRERYTELEKEREERALGEKHLQERVRELERERAADARQLQHNLEIAEQQRETAERKLLSMSKQLQTAEHDLQVKTDEKGLLQTRHDALTTESASLQRDLETTQKRVRELEAAFDEERHRAAQTENILRTQQKNEADLFNEQIDALHREINAKDSQHGSEQEGWEVQRRQLEVTLERAEEKATGLQRTVDKLQESQGTLSSRELNLQQALESEKQRHQDEEKVLLRQMKELNQDLASKRNTSEDSRIELNNAKEELRISIREQAALKDKVAELEEEIEVLQADIEEEHNFAEELQKRSVEGSELQLQKIQEERQALQDQLAHVNIELHAAKKATKSAEAERDEIEVRLQKVEKSADETLTIDREKRELLRSNQKLQKELDRMRSERDALDEANKALEEEINTEIERANAEEHRLTMEIDLLRTKYISVPDTRDRDLTSAKNKVARLEARIKELEDALENQGKIISSPSVDVSGLRMDLVEARKNEAATAKRETELKAKNRELKTQINSLERDLHEAELAKFKARSASNSPPPSHSKEIGQLRQQLVDAQKDLKGMRKQYDELKRQSQSVSIDPTERADLHALVKASTLEAENLALKLSDRERQLGDLRKQVRHLRNREAHHDTQDLSLRLSTRNLEAQKMKSQLQHLREERVIANRRAETVERELDVLQARYEGMLEQLSSAKKDKDDIRDKEIRGLIKHVTYLKAKCRREEQFRMDLVWSKTYLEQGEIMRAQCNQVDLRILREMGVKLDKVQYQPVLLPVQKFRAGVLTVIAAIRMSNLEHQWREVRAIGSSLENARSKQVRRAGLVREV